MTRHVTITRIISVDEARRLSIRVDKDALPSKSPAEMEARLLTHFDFEIVTHIRSLQSSSFSPFKWGQPPEIRRKGNPGSYIGCDKVACCISCCTEKIDWPVEATRILQGEADKEVSISTRTEKGSYILD